MLSEIEDEPQNRSTIWGRVAVVIVLALFLATFTIFATYTDIFTRGSIDDLSNVEREILNEIELMGTRVVASPLTYFGAPAHVIVRVHWNRDVSCYTVTALEVRCESIEPLLPLIQRLTYVRDLRVPLQRRQDIEKLRRIFPEAKVGREPLYSCNHWIGPTMKDALRQWLPRHRVGCIAGFFLNSNRMSHGGLFI